MGKELDSVSEVDQEPTNGGGAGDRDWKDARKQKEKPVLEDGAD